MASVMKATDPQFARALRRALRDHKHVEVALREAIVATLRASGRVVTGATIGRRFSELRGVVAPDELFDFNDEDDCFVLYNALDQSCLAEPERAPKRLWARAGMTAYPDVVTLHDASRFKFVDLHLLTDNRRDWFFVVSHTRVSTGYETEEDPASRRARRRTILGFVLEADSWLSDPGWIETSLTGEDLVWLRTSQPLKVRYRPGRLRTLDPRPTR